MDQRLRSKLAKRESVNELFAAVAERTQAGEDFPTIWNAFLRKHPLVMGLPIQVVVGTEAALKIELVTGNALVMRAGTFYLDP